MNSTTTTVTNADGSIVTTTVVSAVGHNRFDAIYVLALLAVILIASGLYLLFRKEKSVSSGPDM